MTRLCWQNCGGPVPRAVEGDLTDSVTAFVRAALCADHASSAYHGAINPCWLILNRMLWRYRISTGFTDMLRIPNFRRYTAVFTLCSNMKYIESHASLSRILLQLTITWVMGTINTLSTSQTNLEFLYGTGRSGYHLWTNRSKSVSDVNPLAILLLERHYNASQTMHSTLRSLDTLFQRSFRIIG